MAIEIYGFEVDESAFLRMRQFATCSANIADYCDQPVAALIFNFFCMSLVSG